MGHPGVGMVLEAKAARPVARSASGLPMHHPPPPTARLSLPALAIPVRFLVRLQLLTRAVPFPVGRDIQRDFHRDAPDAPGTLILHPMNGYNGGRAMKLHSRQKLVLHKETLRVLKVKTGIKAGAPTQQGAGCT